MKTFILTRSIGSLCALGAQFWVSLSVMGCGDRSKEDVHVFEQLRGREWRLIASYPISGVYEDQIKFTPSPPETFVSEVIDDGRSINIADLPYFTQTPLQDVPVEFGGGFSGNCVTYRLRMHVKNDLALLLVSVKQDEGEGELLAIYATRLE
jgi:hypothetical protein